MILRAVLFDRDGTVIHDVPYNADPARVTLVPMVNAAITLLRAANVAVGLVSNQSGVARGLCTRAQVESVNRRVEQLLGPLDCIEWCPHDDGDRCSCRKPAPGLVVRAAAKLGVPPSSCVVIGDRPSDVEAARRAGAVGLLVPGDAPTALAAVVDLLSRVRTPRLPRGVDRAQ